MGRSFARVGYLGRKPDGSAETAPSPALRKLTDEEKQAAAERRLELQLLRHLKRKYPIEDREISKESM